MPGSSVTAIQSRSRYNLPVLAVIYIGEGFVKCSHTFPRQLLGRLLRYVSIYQSVFRGTPGLHAM